MSIKDIKNVERIIDWSYNENGEPLGNLLQNIETFNPLLTLEQLFEALIILLEFLLNNRIIKLMGTFDKDSKSEVKWKGSTTEVTSKLRAWFLSTSKKKIKSIPQYAMFFEFEYCFVDWLIPYPVDLTKYEIGN